MGNWYDVVFCVTASSGSKTWLGSMVPSVPTFVSHDAVDVSSWRAVLKQIFTKCPARHMAPVVTCILESLRVATAKNKCVYFYLYFRKSYHMGN